MEFVFGLSFLDLINSRRLPRACGRTPPPRRAWRSSSRGRGAWSSPWRREQVLFSLSFTAMVPPCASPESRTAVLAARLSDERERGEVAEEVKVKEMEKERDDCESNSTSRQTTTMVRLMPHHLHLSLSFALRFTKKHKTEPAPERRL